ncbi:outer membrane protein assembly factor BamB family protein [Streptomyces zagrosensis]|uniref:Outer membrane protein assembly factor BamB n=1 Tax=Streptomyces zagrosensis TaxID=1042984 RepID=A0A7W9V3L3_9ACTN|nr:PQQ-binding-like beta-propeller repeat protein [Streptomyces zagrosensis]MBB5940034.1 outer membrane protein assembly factor BamB [Streptomyces zagrosensis]
MPGPPGGGQDGQRKKRMAIIIGAAVAVVLAAGGGVWAVVGGDDGDKEPKAHRSTEPKKKESAEPTKGSEGESAPPEEEELDPNEIRQDGEAKVLFQTPAPKVTRSGVDVPGFWVMDGYVVKTVQTKVVAYDNNGEEKWNVPLPKAVCAAPTTANDDGKVVIAYEGRKKDECSQLALIDLTAGKKLWDKPAPEGGLFGEGHNSLGMAQSGNAVGLSWFGGSAMVSVKDGSEIEAPDLTASCSVKGWAGGKALLRAYSCNDGTAKLQKVDPATGKATWAYPVRKGFDVAKVYSTNPVVIHLTDEKRKSGGIIAIKEGGQERAVLDLGKQSYQPDCGMDIFGSSMGGCQGVVASDDTFFLPTSLGKSSTSGLTTEIHAFSLDTGKKKWESKVAGRMMSPLRMDGKNLIAYQEPTYDKAGAIVSISPSGGEPKKTELQLPAATREAEDGFYRTRRIFDEQGRFYMASERLTGDDESEKLILAFGP